MPGTTTSTTCPVDQRRIALRAFPDTPGVCRSMAMFAAHAWGADHDAAALITAELAANAVRETLAARDRVPGPGGAPDVPLVYLRLYRFPGTMRIEVWDRAGGQPVMAEPDWEAEHGRGLCLVNAYADGHWGWHPAPPTEREAPDCKCVWATLPCLGGQLGLQVPAERS